MTEILKVEGLTKKYPSFTLDNISFNIHEGEIMGLIGRNGAGKTTTIKSLLKLIHSDGGKIEFFGMNLNDSEFDIKQRIGYTTGAVDYYKKKKLSKIVDVTKQFYSSWDENEYRKYMDIFSLDENKTPSELSEGMKVKFNLAIAMSHHAGILILDEPTSGLDPVSRDELLEIFRYIADEGTAILYSTHITSDLEKCADSITYIQKGKLMSSLTKNDFIAEYKNKGLGDTLEEIMINSERSVLHEKLHK